MKNSIVIGGREFEICQCCGKPKRPMGEVHPMPSCPIRVIGEQSGKRASSGRHGESGSGEPRGIFGIGSKRQDTYWDTGTAARYFLNLPPDEPLIRYQAKPSKREKNEGLDGFDTKGKIYNGQSDAPAGCAPGSVEDKFSTQPQANHHPTTKSLELMRYFVKLTKTPTGGVVLDPFMGSGTTGVACVAEGRDFIGIEMNEDYFEIAKARIEHEQKKPKQLELL